MDLEFKPHPLDWLVHDLREQESYLERPMFGCRACYLRGELQLVLASSGEDPWNGLLVATCRERQVSLLADFPELKPHSILPKWLYIAERSEQFEAVSQQIVQLVLKNDPRIGVEPGTKKRKKKAPSPKRAPRKAKNKSVR